MLRALAVYCTFLWLLIATEASAENASNLMNLFGGILQSAIVQATIAEWRKIPVDELSCIGDALQKRGVSVQSLMQQGIAPFDSRLSDVRSSCRAKNAPSVPQSAAIIVQNSPTSAYTVEGLALGAKVSFNSNVYHEYDCRPSEQFGRFTWCHREKSESGPRGVIRSSYTILHSEDGTVAYVNRELDSALFGGPHEVDIEIERLSGRFGNAPQIMRIPAGTNHRLGSGVIAVWGKAILEPLDASSRVQLAAGKSPRRGILVDYLGNFQRSVQDDLPVFRVIGGAGFVWSASFDGGGLGRLRFFAIDSSTLTANEPPVVVPRPPSPDPWKDCQSADAETRLKGCTIVIDAKGDGSRTRLADALDGRCSAYNEKQDYEHAISDCKAAIEVNPRYSYAYGNLGISYLKLRDYPNAIAALDGSIDLKTDFLWSHLNRAQAFETSGKTRPALMDYQYALVIDPSNHTATEGVIRLSRNLGATSTDLTPFSCTTELPTIDPRLAALPSSADAPGSPSISLLRHAISQLEDYIRALNDQVNRSMDRSASLTREAETIGAQLTARIALPRSALADLQKLVTSSFEIRSKIDHLSEQITDLDSKMDRYRKDAASRSATRKALHQLQSDLDALSAQRVSAEMDLEKKKTAIDSARDAAGSEISKYAALYVKRDGLEIDADRSRQCAEDVKRRVAALAQQLTGFQLKQRNELLVIERLASDFLLSDLTEFAKQNSNAIPIEIAPLVASLKGTLGSDDPKVISQGRVALEGRLNSIVGFTHFRAAREDERTKKVTAELTDLTTKMKVLSHFIQTYIRSNITSDLIEPLMKLNGELTAALVVPQMDNLTRVLPDAELRITELGLATAYEGFKKIHSGGGSLTLSPTTSKNRYLVQGPEDEILFLVNDTGRAHVVRDLRGQLVFDDNKATVCFPHPLDLDRFSLLQVRLEIIAKGAQEVSFAATPCPMDFLAESDIVVVARRLLVRSSKEMAQALLEAIDKDELAQIGVLTEREIKDRRDSESLKSLEIEDGIEGSTRFGYGIVATDNSSSIICQAANDDHPKAHDALISRWRDRLEYEFQSRPVVAVTSIESGFIRIKRGECRAVYAPAESLKELIEGFKRDKVNFHVLPIWFARADFEDAKVEVAKAEALCAQQWQDLKRKREDDAALIKLRARQSGEEHQNREDELRKQYGSAARSLEKMILSEIKEYVESPTERHLGVRQRYPQFVSWFEGALRDGWEVLSINGELDDYGVVEWKGRVLEAGFTDVRIRMQNRDRGEYQDGCYVFGYVLDKEFDRARDAVVVKCNEQAAIERYKLGQRFSSRWIAEALPPSEAVAPPSPPDGCSGSQTSPPSMGKRSDLGPSSPLSEDPTQNAMGPAKRESAASSQSKLVRGRKCTAGRTPWVTGRPFPATRDGAGVSLRGRCIFEAAA